MVRVGSGVVNPGRYPTHGEFIRRTLVSRTNDVMLPPAAFRRIGIVPNKRRVSTASSAVI